MNVLITHTRSIKQIYKPRQIEFLKLKFKNETNELGGDINLQNSRAILK